MYTTGMFKFTSTIESIQRHAEAPANNISRPVEDVQNTVFNEFTVGPFFSQVIILFEEVKTRDGFQVTNLDETGFPLSRPKFYCVLSKASKIAALPDPQFKYLYRITVVGALQADGTDLEPAVVFRDKK